MKGLGLRAEGCHVGWLLDATKLYDAACGEPSICLLFEYSVYQVECVLFGFWGFGSYSQGLKLRV